MHDELARALRTLLGEAVELVAAGRTDRGVHALGQVVSYSGSLPSLRSVNALLPDDVGVVGAEATPDGFSARHDALARTYVYRLHTRRYGPSPFCRGRALWWPHVVDLPALEACATALPGTHDLTAFTPSETSHRLFERTVHAASWTRLDHETLEFRIEARTFMRGMNRILVGTMLEVASGRRSVEDFVSLLAGAPRSRAGATAPPHGLYLESVRY